MAKPAHVHVTPMRAAFEDAARGKPENNLQKLVKSRIKRRRYKPGVVFHRKGWFKKLREADRGMPRMKPAHSGRIANS